MPEKVYCIRCSHFYGTLSVKEECLAEIKKEWSTYFKQYVRYASPKKKNKNNNCHDFELRDVRR